MRHGKNKISKGGKCLIYSLEIIGNSLHALDNLSTRGVPVEAVCPICRTSNETVTHVLWTCVSANRVWTS